MARLPVLKPREVIAILNALGFACVRQRGARMQFRHADGRATTVPDHRGRDISPTLLRKIHRRRDRVSLLVLARVTEGISNAQSASF